MNVVADRSPAAPRRAGAGGFTLIELLIAVALLAVLAVLSWRGLDAVLESRRKIVEASDELRTLTLAFAQLDEDLRRSWPVRLLKLDVPSIGFTVSGERAIATLEVLREATGASEPTQVQRVAWRLRDGVLERGFGLRLAPSTLTGTAAAGSGGTLARGAGGDDDPARSLVWQPVLAGVAALQMQGWVGGQGWIAAEALAGQLSGEGGAAAAGAPARPAVTGLQLRVVRTDGRVLQRILPVKD